LLMLSALPVFAGRQATKLAYNTPGALADLGVGLWGWPLPMDYNHDGLMDLVVVSSGRPSNGVYFFENTGQVDLQTKLPIFKPGRWLGPAPKDTDSPQVSYGPDGPIVTTPGNRYPDFLRSAFARPEAIPAPAQIFDGHSPIPKPAWPNDVRAYQWRYVDFYGTGKLDLVVGNDYWGDYNWEGSHRIKNPAFDARGQWKYGPLHGYVYVLRNLGTNDRPRYAAPEKLMAGNQPIDVYGTPSPSVGDFRGVGKLDLICGEFLDGFTYFENIGTRTQPRYAPGRRLMNAGVPIAMDSCMITPVAVDFFGRGRLDLVCGDEDGRIALIENTGQVIDGMPQFLPPRYFRQVAENVKFGALTAPSAGDFFGHGRDDLVVGNAAGFIGLIENLGGNPPRWAAPRYLAAGGELVRIQAGYNGDCQGPSEAKWGYTNVSAADWDGDGLLDILCSDVWGKVYWYRNIGTKSEPKFASAQPINVDWAGPTPKPSWNWWNPAGQQLVTQWRCTPCAIDWNGDGLVDLVMVDPDGYLALYERRRAADGTLHLLPGKRVFRGQGVSVFDQQGQPMNHEDGLLRLNGQPGGSSGRRTYCFMDWDGDGIPDLMVNSMPNIDFLKGKGRDAQGNWVFEYRGAVVPDQPLARHSTCATAVHWADPKRADLVFGAEDGFFYYLPHP